MISNTKRQAGGVSLFIVIFTTLIVTIITVSFTQLMVRNQQLASENDLAQRAYDSALAGVEDAKRLLVVYQNCNTGVGNICADYKNKIDAQKCSTIQDSNLVSASGNEVQVGEAADNQAYTCVKIDTKSPNFEGYLEKDNSAVIPLIGREDFTKVRISWFTSEDSSSPSPMTDTAMSLPQPASWTPNTPPILRAQYIPQIDDPSNLDTQAKTLFLYPLNVGSSGLKFADVTRIDSAKSPSPVACNSSGIGGICSIDVEVPPKPASGVVYLQLMAIYNKTHFTVELVNSTGSIVYFDNVQPIVDSTGRAENLFRRVKARVKLGGVPLAYPDSAINVRGPLCKTLFVTNDANDFKPGDCTLP